MNNITLLDCTLRDGGYVNDWQFGEENAKKVISLLSDSGVDYMEVGFITLDEYLKGKIQFNQMSEIIDLFYPWKNKLAAMVEVGYGYPVDSFPERSDKTVDLVRVIIWKRLLKEGLEYCKRLKDKGYEVGVQATRTDQYSDEEFADFINNFNSIKPDAVYIVDTFGLLDKKELLRYANIADKELWTGGKIGYHAHNNMQQALTNAIAFTEKEWKHGIMVDASIMGMGRGAGNLPIELYMQYLNDNFGTEFDINPLLTAFQNNLQHFYTDSPWGYSLPYYLSAINGRNPSYVQYLEGKAIEITDMAKIFSLMRERDLGIVYDTNMCEELIHEINGYNK